MSADRNSKTMSLELADKDTKKFGKNEEPNIDNAEEVPNEPPSKLKTFQILFLR